MLGAETFFSFPTDPEDINHPVITPHRTTMAAKAAIAVAWTMTTLGVRGRRTTTVIATTAREAMICSLTWSVVRLEIATITGGNGGTAAVVVVVMGMKRARRRR